MCGISFIHHAGISQDALREQMRQSLERMHHRGPDDSGLINDMAWAIGHRRLSIIDLRTSKQPMQDQSKRYCLAYNGETYNFRALRQNLATDWDFRTAGDTEVVMAGLILEGPAFLQKMQGMWALCLWDRQEQQLLLARDRIGKKPLYYESDTRRFACASEINALLALSPGYREEDIDSAADYLRYGYFLPGTTIYKGMNEVLPGHWLRWSPGKQPTQQTYWTLPIGRFTGSRAEAGHIMKEKLTAAIERRLVADVEVGAFLSGGIDSSLIVALLGTELETRPKTFSIGFSDRDFDERPYARMVADRYGTDHHEDCVTVDDADILTGLVLNHVGQPFADSSLLPSSFVARLASRHIKVALSGDGADEIFSGYQRYHSRTLMRWYTRLPSHIRRQTARLIRALPEPTAHHSRSLLKKAHLFLDIEQRLRDETPYIAPLMYSSDDFKQLAPGLADRGHPPPSLPRVTEPDDIQTMMAADALVYLPQDNLLKVDRASMAHSLEVRSPFVDHDVVEFAFSLPRAWHRSGMTGKNMLRRYFASLLPPALWRRRKQGFAVPVHAWFRQGMETRLRQCLRETDAPVSPAFVERLIVEHQRGRRDHGYRLWSIYIYLLWRNGDT